MIVLKKKIIRKTEKLQKWKVIIPLQIQAMNMSLIQIQIGHFSQKHPVKGLHELLNETQASQSNSIHNHL